MVKPLPVVPTCRTLFGSTTNLIFLKSTKLRDGAYYATTARRFRELGADNPENDLLLELIEANGNRFERHFWFFGLRPDSWFTDGRTFHSDEQFRLSFIGEFLK